MDAMDTRLLAVEAALKVPGDGTGSSGAKVVEDAKVILAFLKEGENTNEAV